MPILYDPTLCAAALVKADKSLAKVIRRAGPCTLRPESLRSPFHALARAIIYQQLSGKAAATIFGRVEGLFPGRRKLRPEDIAEVDEQLLRAAGASRNKVLALKDLAAKTLDGTVPSLARMKKMEDEEIVERLVAVRGIGPWTVEMLLIFRLGRADVFPTSDLGVRKGFMLTYGLKELPSPAEMIERGERWRPHRSIASWYLWRAVDLHQQKIQPRITGK